MSFYFISVCFIKPGVCPNLHPSIGQAYVAEERLVQQSTILLNNAAYLVPLQNLDQLKIASVHFANQYASGFDSLLNKYSKVVVINGNDYRGIKNLDDLSSDLKWYNTLIVQLNEADLNDPVIADFINNNQKIKNVIIVLFGGTNALVKLNNVTVPVIWSQRVSPVSAFYAAQAIFGGVPITQKLNNNLSPVYKAGMGFTTNKTRLQYTVPGGTGVNSSDLLAIDNVAFEAMFDHATPGCVVLVAKDGKVIFNKAYGYHTYDKTLPDKLTDIFDIASVTKSFGHHC